MVSQWSPPTLVWPAGWSASSPTRLLAIRNTPPLTYMQWIMGLAALRTAWQRQTRDFGHAAAAARHRCLVLDNRGIGRSDAPLLRYTTSEMARDVVELLDHVGWTAPRQVHVVGASMGGMIAQELVCSAAARALRPQ